MKLPDFLLYLAIGKLITWLLQTNGLTRPIWKLHPILAELEQCDLCLGFWVYLVLALFLRSTLSLWPGPINRIVLAALSSFMAHLLRLGWENKFGVVIEV